MNTIECIILRVKYKVTLVVAYVARNFYENELKALTELNNNTLIIGDLTEIT